MEALSSPYALLSGRTEPGRNACLQPFLVFNERNTWEDRHLPAYPKGGLSVRAVACLPTNTSAPKLSYTSSSSEKEKPLYVKGRRGVFGACCFLARRGRQEKRWHGVWERWWDFERRRGRLSNYYSGCLSCLSCSLSEKDIIQEKEGVPPCSSLCLLTLKL